MGGQCALPGTPQSLQLPADSCLSPEVKPASPLDPETQRRTVTQSGSPPGRHRAGMGLPEHGLEEGVPAGLRKTFRRRPCLSETFAGCPFPGPIPRQRGRGRQEMSEHKCGRKAGGSSSEARPPGAPPLCHVCPGRHGGPAGPELHLGDWQSACGSEWQEGAERGAGRAGKDKSARRRAGHRTRGLRVLVTSSPAQPVPPNRMASTLLAQRGSGERKAGRRQEEARTGAAEP